VDVVNGKHAIVLNLIRAKARHIAPPFGKAKNCGALERKNFAASQFLSLMR